MGVKYIYMGAYLEGQSACVFGDQEIGQVDKIC